MSDTDTDTRELAPPLAPGSTRVLGAVDASTATILKAFTDMETRLLGAIQGVGDRIVTTIEESSKPFQQMADTLDRASTRIGEWWERAKALAWKAFGGAATVGGGSLAAWWSGLIGG